MLSGVDFAYGVRRPSTQICVARLGEHTALWEFEVLSIPRFEKINQMFYLGHHKEKTGSS